MLLSAAMKIDLPNPDAPALLHSQRLQQVILDEIKTTSGRIPFARFMQMVLYNPGLGYYRSGAKKFGQGGDFVTAPELSPSFSWVLARQIQQVLCHCVEPCILELGAGSGIMALEILRELERCDSLPQKYFILEVSAELKMRQYQLIAAEAPQYLERMHWLQELPRQPISGVIIGNEVLDAMPVHKFKIEKGVQEYFVSEQQGEFCWQLGAPSTTALTAAVEDLGIELEQGYTSEINLWLTPWIKSLSESLQQGLILLIDYGYVRAEYFHPQRSMGTLMCHYQHRAHDNPLILPGIQDITAHVDFTAVAMAADQAELEVAGFTHQAAFLMNGGLLDFQQNLAEDAVAHYQRAQQIKRLTLPSEMGERFKVMALTRDFSQALLGFAQFDQTDRL